MYMNDADVAVIFPVISTLPLTICDALNVLLPVVANDIAVQVTPLSVE
jgi:hypothetical protein